MRAPLFALTLCTAVEACAPDLVEVEEKPRTLTVAGDVMIDSINPAYGFVAIVDPEGRRIVVTSIIEGRYRLGRTLPVGTDVCDGFGVYTEITEEVGSRSQSRALAETSGDCVVSASKEIVHHVDLDFPIVIGRARGGGR